MTRVLPPAWAEAKRAYLTDPQARRDAEQTLAEVRGARSRRYQDDPQDFDGSPVPQVFDGAPVPLPQVAFEATQETSSLDEEVHRYMAAQGLDYEAAFDALWHASPSFRHLYAES